VDTSGTKGSVVINADGTITYNPNGKFENLGDDEKGTDKFTYFISDRHGGTDSATATVVVQGINDAPNAADDEAHTNENTSTVINVLSNDTDVEANRLVVAGVDTTGTHGAVAINPDGTITYNPDGQFAALAPGESATDTFQYTVSDRHGGVSTATVTVTVDGVNDAPLADPVLTAADPVPTGLDPALGTVVFFKALDVAGGVDGDITVRETNPADLGGVDAETPASALAFHLTSLPALGSVYIDHGGSDAGGGSWVKLTAGNLATERFSTADHVCWVANTDDLSTGVTAGATRLIGGLSAGLDQWQQFGVSIAAQNFDGTPGTLAFERDGAGVAGGAPVTNQINYGNDLGQSEKFIVDFHNPVVQADVRISSLIPYEHGGEVGRVTASFHGAEVGSWTFSHLGSNADLTFDVDSKGVGWLNLPRDVTFDKLEFGAAPYADGTTGKDSSDYFVRAIEYVEGNAPPQADSVAFAYQVTDAQGASADAQVIIDMLGDHGATALDVAAVSADGTPQIGGAGDDSLVYDPLAPTIDGAAGYDTLHVGGGHDLTGSSAIHNVEALQITNSGAADNTVTLSLQDVVNFTDNNNVLHVEGGTGARVDIGSASDWSAATSDQASYSLYVAASGDPVKLYVEDHVNVVTTA